MCFLGIDIGSLTCDAVLIDEACAVLASSVVFTGARNQQAVKKAADEALQTAGVSSDRVKAIVSTGYGRKRVPGTLASVTEITCHARGICALQKDSQVLIDIGGQDSKAVRLDERGNVVDFAMNDKCAAGTGRFIEAMARALQVDIETLAQMDSGAGKNLVLSSTCTVFAESEVVSLIADGVAPNEIVSGLNHSIAARTTALVKRVVSDTAGLNVAMSGAGWLTTGGLSTL